MANTATVQRTGRVVQVIGPVIDIEFTGGLPEIYNAVRIVSEGGPGVEKIDVVKPDLVILDIRLPGIDGCKALQKLREAGHKMPVFMFSEVYDLMRDQIESCQPDAFFPKSKGPLEMIEAIGPKLASVSAP